MGCFLISRYASKLVFSPVGPYSITFQLPHFASLFCTLYNFLLFLTTSRDTRGPSNMIVVVVVVVVVVLAIYLKNTDNRHNS